MRRCCECRRQVQAIGKILFFHDPARPWEIADSAAGVRVGAQRERNTRLFHDSDDPGIFGMEVFKRCFRMPVVHLVHDFEDLAALDKSVCHILDHFIRKKL